ncbi:MAG: hypothetical protein V4794_20500 [Pseudomonadota bacterium]
MPLKIDYSLIGTGWAKCTISDGQSEATVSASYLSDALGNLLIAACAALREFRAITFSFDEEPGEFRWVLISLRPNEYALEILEFSDLYGDAPNSEGTSLFKSTFLPETFATAVRDAAAGLLRAVGADGYKEAWHEHPFPMEQFGELERLLALNG